LGQGLCSGEWLTKVTTYDKLRVPEHLVPGEYVLSFRWDCESSAQIWQSCSDITSNYVSRERRKAARRTVISSRTRWTCKSG
jgi:hypothetical protein